MPESLDLVHGTLGAKGLTLYAAVFEDVDANGAYLLINIAALSAGLRLAFSESSS